MVALFTFGKEASVAKSCLSNSSIENCHSLAETLRREKKFKESFEVFKNLCEEKSEACYGVYYTAVEINRDYAKNAITLLEKQAKKSSKIYSDLATFYQQEHRFEDAIKARNDMED